MSFLTYKLYNNVLNKIRQFWPSCSADTLIYSRDKRYVFRGFQHPCIIDCRIKTDKRSLTSFVILLLTFFRRLNVSCFVVASRLTWYKCCKILGILKYSTLKLKLLLNGRTVNKGCFFINLSTKYLLLQLFNNTPYLGL